MHEREVRHSIFLKDFCNQWVLQVDILTMNRRGEKDFSKNGIKPLDLPNQYLPAYFQMGPSRLMPSRQVISVTWGSAVDGVLNPSA